MEKKQEPLRFPPVTYTNASWTDSWICNRCGAFISEDAVKLHASFHKTQDILIEKLMIMADKEEQRIKELDEMGFG